MSSSRQHVPIVDLTELAGAVAHAVLNTSSPRIVEPGPTA